MNIEHYFLEPFKEDNPHIKAFFDDIDDVWFEKGGEASIQGSMRDKIFKEKKFDVFPYLLQFKNEPVGIVWVELSTNSYGNITMHFPESEHIEPAVFLLKQKGYFKNKLRCDTSNGAKTL